MIIGINTAVTYPDPFAIGRQRENEVTQVQFDVSEWVRTYGLGTLALSVQRRRDMRPYPVPIAIVDGAATWTISNTDTAQDGHIKAQLTYMVGTKIKKSKVYMLTVKASLPEDGRAPDGYTTWLETLQELTSQVAANAVSASAASVSAAQSAEAASTSARNAGTSSTQAANAASAASASAASAAASAELAEQSAANAGYVMFDVHDDDGQLYVVKTDSLNTLNFRVDENTGSLGVITNG
jgi:hypothetical protein